ncbi:GNAT family N-acetyltransferase [Paraburkholderia phosphatilytica]|uniref:GNAT family N-acetyltransferase n=1 Tax=Paraburkholderia phosphatilytica TaxID=2282883 RepID=UPI000E551897
MKCAPHPGSAGPRPARASPVASPTPSATLSASPSATVRAAGHCWLREPAGDDLVAIEAWFANPAANQWFDFGQGRQSLPMHALRAMLLGGRHYLRVFGEAPRAEACGLVAVNDVTHPFASGSFWVLRDPLCHARPGITCDASVCILREVFKQYGLRSVSAWAVECNVRSQRLLTRVGFRRIGLQRYCHRLDGQYVGRILYDLVPAELDDGRWTSCSA